MNVTPEQVRQWRETFVNYPDSDIVAIGYQLCEQLLEEMDRNAQLSRRVRCFDGGLQMLYHIAKEPLPYTTDPRYHAGLVAMDDLYRTAINGALEIAILCGG